MGKAGLSDPKYRVRNKMNRILSMKETRRLFQCYENELLPLLPDKDEYLKNNSTNQSEHEEGWLAKFDANRQAHLKLLNAKLADDTCYDCWYLGFVCSCAKAQKLGCKPARPTQLA